MIGTPKFFRVSSDFSPSRQNITSLGSNTAGSGDPGGGTDHHH
ncbi:MAG: hypothetical protein WAM14_05320 [Candidatus Nitrosopolaris sp.]